MPSLDLAIFVALREELRSVHPLLERARPIRVDSVKCLSARLGGREVLVARTGIGRKNAAEKCAAVLKSQRPVFLVATGFAGGLHPELQGGDILIAQEVCEVVEEPSSQGSGFRRPTWTAPRDVLDALLRLEVPGQKVRSGRLVTTERVLSSSGEKEKMGEALKADAVDMESSGILRASAEKGVPALCVRAILDELDFELPFDFGKILTREGKPRPLKSLQAVLGEPGKLLDLLDLRARARRAGRSLEVFLPKLVKALFGPA